MKSLIVLFLITLFIISNVYSQSDVWNGKNCAVVLTYDDALNVHLDEVIPCLDSFDIKGTFYLTGESSVLDQRMEEWRLAAAEGHELGNHSLTHPCDGSLDGRDWVSAETDLSKYSLHRVVNEIKITNTLLKAVDGKEKRTFAYPCGDSYVDTINYYPFVQNDFVAARGVKSSFQKIDDVDLTDVDCFAMNGQSGAEMIDLVKKAIKSQTLLVFLFHGVGGEHFMNVSAEAHSQLIHFLSRHKKEIWIAPMVDVAKFIRNEQVVLNK